MLSIRPTHDLTLLRQLIADDSIRAALGDDSTASNVDLNEFIPDGSKVYQVDDDESPVGVFVFRPVSDGAFEMHTILGKTCRGKKAVEAGRKAVASMFDDGVSTLVSYVFSDAPAALWFAHKIGFESVRREHYPHTRNGASVDVIHLLAKHS